MYITLIFICTIKKKRIKKYGSLAFQLQKHTVPQAKLPYVIASTITKIENIPDFYSLVGLSGDMLFYTKNWNDKYLSCMAYWHKPGLLI